MTRLLARLIYRWAAVRTEIVRLNDNEQATRTAEMWRACGFEDAAQDILDRIRGPGINIDALERHTKQPPKDAA